MSVSPLTLNGMLQRTNDFSTMKQNEDNKPATEQQMLASHQVEQEQEQAHKVSMLKQKENEGYRYDAKEKGNGSYEGKQKKKQNRKESENANEKVILKGQGGSHFDIKI